MKNTRKDYLTKKEFCKFCGISDSTGYKVIKEQNIHFEKCQEGRLHFYKIPLSEAISYKAEQRKKRTVSAKQRDYRRQYYESKLRSYPDVIEAKDIRAITGYGKEIIRKWINSEKILGIVVRKRFKVAKDDLIDFLVDTYYHNIIRKSATHRADIQELQRLYGGAA